MKKTLRSMAGVQSFADEFVNELSPLQEAALIVGLSGDLGSGKTAFVKAVAKAFGVAEEVTSPTYVIEKIYKLPKSTGRGFEHLIHIDAYRLEGGKELVTLGWNEIISKPGNVIFLEWPEQVKDVLPPGMKMLRFTFIDENTREVES